MPTPHDSGYKPLFSDPLMVRGLVQGFIDDQLGVSSVMSVGGTFDVMAGKVKRAPLWMQRWGLEWLYRVIQEPRRMWKRYLVTKAKFGGRASRDHC